MLLGDELYKWSVEDLLLKSLDHNESMRVMAEVHEGIYGSHKSGPKMRWLIHRYGYFWPTMAADYISYAKGCAACQWHGPIQKVLADELHPIIKLWPFKGWAIDLIGTIHPFF